MLGLTLSVAQYGSFAVSVIALAILLAAGRAPERLAAATLACLMFASPYLSRGAPTANAAASGLALAMLVFLALRYERWWLIGAAGFQLVVFSTHFATLFILHERIWSTVTLRLILWEGLIVLCFFAIGESRWASYARAESRTKPTE
ncbi:MAG: hypothetical protein WAU68_04105 [Vitreimonas sp.]